jgi:Domain of unknown function (DUF222)
MVDETTIIGELLAACSRDALAGMGASELSRHAASFLALWARLDAARLQLLAAMETAQAYRVDGCRDLASWLAWKSGERRGAARRDVELAASVGSTPVVADALAEGSLSKAKAAELTRAADASVEEQAQLVAVAVESTPEQLARQVDRWQLERDRAPVVEELLTVTPVPGGARVEATLDAEGGEWVQTAVDAAAEQLGLRDLPWGQRRARGLVAVARYFLEHADLPLTRVGRPTVVVTVDIATLTAPTGGSGRLDSGAYVTGATARRLACDAGIVRLITDPASMPLDVGRRTRVPSPAQCRAVIHRDRHCRYEGCQAAPWACEVHHLDFWARDHGRTDLDRLVLICWHHHGLTHQRSGTHDLVEGGDRRLYLRPRQRAHPDAA